MTEVIYADVLVIINIYITYALLALTGALIRKKKSPLRMVAASVLSGFYSLIILIPGITEGIIGLSKLFFSVLLVFIAFPLKGKKQIIKATGAFFIVNFAFGGLMLALWLFVAPSGMYYNNSIVYFDIDTGVLLFLTVVCYVILSIGERFISRRAPKGTVYDCTLYIKGKSYYCRCFLDTGNSLRDCYTGAPVIIVNSSVFHGCIADDIGTSEIPMRLIPCCTVSGQELLNAISCERAELRSVKGSYAVSDITVALTANKIRQGSYDGILPCDIFENTTNEREKCYVRKA